MTPHQSAISDTNTMDLSGTWSAGIANDELRRTWYDESFDDSGFAKITVPGHWQRYDVFADNVEPLLFRHQFSTERAPEHVRSWLCFDGICTQGDIWFDGSYLGITEGAWVPHTFEVTSAIKERQDHTIGVEVNAPTTMPGRAKRTLLGTWQDSPYVLPHWNPGGIWRPVRLRQTGPVAIIAHRVLCTTASSSRATISITCTLNAAHAMPVTIRTVVDDSVYLRTQNLAGGANQVTWDVDISQPKLWWPYELGDQPMTNVAVDIRVGDDSHTSDSFVAECGLREITMDDWIATINGERLFVRGVLVGPAAHEMGTAPDTVFARQVHDAKEAGCNLMRIHAHLSNRALYREADRLGMLIWQDLPLYRKLHRSVRRVALSTAQAAINTLGAHPSIAIWCAHDEPDDSAHDFAAHPRTSSIRRFTAHEAPNRNRSRLDVALKRSMRGADQTRPIIASSGTWPHPPSFRGTDTHVRFGWTSGTANDLDRLARVIPRAARFVQITPSPSLSKTHGPLGPQTWPRVDLAAQLNDPNLDIATIEQRLPRDAFDDSEDWANAGRNYQAALIREQVETLRRIKYRPTGGFSIGHLRDHRASMTPSLIDTDGNPKPAFHALHQACAPTLVTLSPWPHCAHNGDIIECAVHVISDLRVAIDAATVAVQVHIGSEELNWKFLGTIPPDECVYVGVVTFEVPKTVERITAHARMVAEGIDTTHRDTIYQVPVHVH